MTTVGLDVGGTKILGVALDTGARVLAERRVPSPTGAGPLVAALADVARDLGSEAGAAMDAMRVGIGIAGMVDLSGTVLFSPNLPGLRRAAVGDALAEELGVPVMVDNDANAAALAEATLGAGRGHRYVLVVTLGTGIGGGLVVDGAVARGAHGFFGEVGHVVVERGGPPCACGGAGHWEAIASGRALDRLAREAVAAGRGGAIAAVAAGADVTGVHVATAAAGGDEEAMAVLDLYAENVAVGLAGLCNVLDPDAVIIGGGVASLGDLLMAPLRREMAEYLEGTDVRPPIVLRLAELGESASAIGAALLARNLP